MGYLSPDKSLFSKSYASYHHLSYQLIGKGISEKQPWLVVYKGWPQQLDIHSSESTCKDSNMMKWLVVLAALVAFAECLHK